VALLSADKQNVSWMTDHDGRPEEGQPEEPPTKSAVGEILSNALPRQIQIDAAIDVDGKDKPACVPALTKPGDRQNLLYKIPGQ